MKIIEQQVIGKHTADDCEDGVVVTAAHAAVIDGSTSKTPCRLHPAMANGRYCMILIAEYIRSMDSDISLDDFCEGITSLIRQQYSHLDLSSHTGRSSAQPIAPVQRLCASAAIYSRKRQEIWLVGDCQCMIDGMLHDNPKPYEAALAEQRAERFAQCQQAHPDMLCDLHIAHDYARDEIVPSLIAGMDNQNKTYAVIDGYPIYRPGIKLIPVERPGAEIVLASDGYPHLFPTLAESEAALEAQLARDPFNISTFKATKGLMVGNQSFDDRSYIRLTSE